MKNIQHFLLWVVLLMGTWLRLYKLGEWGYSNDELSALFSSQVNSWHTLFLHVSNDGHPAFTLVFESIWQYCFGTSEWIMRLPFVVLSVASLYIFYLVGKRLFNDSTALLALIVFSCSEFTCLYGRLARPYAIGIFFVMCTAYCFARLFLSKHPTLKWWFLLAICLAACAYTHYFSLLTAATIYGTGVFVMNRQKLCGYLCSGLLACLLFVPHIPLTKQQLCLGGLDWLAPPTIDFFENFFLTIFNNSKLLLYAVLVFFALSICISLWRKRGLLPAQALCFAWFLLPLIVGYVYSIYFAPVLQERALLFSLPFALLFLFSFFQTANKTLYLAVCLGLAVLFFYHTLVVRQFFVRTHYPPFKELANSIAHNLAKFPNDKTMVAVKINNPKYLTFYTQQLPQSFSFYYLNPDSSCCNEIAMLTSDTTLQHFIYARSNVAADHAAIDFLRMKFGSEVIHNQYFEADVYCFTKL